MASPAIEQLRAERAAQRATTGYKPIEYTPPNQNPKYFGVEITPDFEEKSFGQKVLQDTALLAYGVPTALAKIGTGIFTDPVETVKMVGGGLIQTGKDIIGTTGFLGEEAQKESFDYYKAHPVMGLLDAWGVATLGTGAALKAGLTSTARSAIKATVEVGLREGIEESVIRSAMQTVRSALNPKRILGAGETRVASPFLDAISSVVRTGKTDGVITVVRDALVKGGVAEDVAFRIAQTTGKTVAESVVKQSSKLKILDGITHPVSAAFRGAKVPVGAVSRAILGTSEETAVGRLFGNEVVQANKKSALGLERWLEANALERGIENTVESRLRILMEWKGQSDFSNLTTEQLFRDFDNYVQHDVKLRRLRDLTGNEFVGVKALSKETAESMASTAKENISRIADEVGEIAGATPEKKVDMVFDRLGEFLEQNYGRDFTKYAPILRKAFGSKGSIPNLERAILRLSSTKPTISFSQWSTEAQALAKELEGFGYQVAHAPTGKKVSFAADVVEGGAKDIQAMQFHSPNVEENISFGQAVKRLTSKEQKSFRTATNAIDEKLGITGKSVDAIGDWSDGAENTVYKEITSKIDYETLRYSSAAKGKLGMQKAVIPFLVEKGGADTLYRFTAKSSLESMRKILDKAGLQFRTLVPLADGKVSVVIFDSGSQLIKNVKGLGKKYGNIEQFRGKGEFLGAETRTEAASIFDEIIGEYERGSGAGGRGLVNQSVPALVTESAFDTQRTFVGKVLDKFGFSTQGVVEGTNEFLFKQSWVQNAINTIGEKFGGIIKIEKPVAVKTTTGVLSKAQKISIPVDKLYEWLYNHKAEIFATRTGVGTFKAFRPVSVFDITTDDLVRFGFNPEVAKTVQEVSKQSLRAIPTSVTGIGEKLVNLLRTADVGFAKFGSFYDTFLKTAYYMRYQSGLSVMFQAQQYIETKLMSALITKNAKLLPGVEGLAGFGERMIPAKVSGILGRAKTYLQKITKDPELNELVIARDDLLPNVRKALEDTMGTPEFARIKSGIEGTTKTVETGADIMSRQRVEAFWLQMFGGWSQGMAAKTGKAIAEKFGMTLEEATEFTMKDGNKIYKHPQLVRTMQDAVQETLHYKVGFPTSPLAKTLNIIWFPFRFQAKTIGITAKWLGSISPTSRAIVVNNWVHFSNWAGTDEGIEWRKTHKNLLYSILAYTTAWEQMGDSIESVSRGRLFGGQTGLIGGVPFGFIYNTAQELALIPDDPEQVDPATGRLFRFKDTPKDLISDASFLVALEEFVFMMLPGMPLYTVTGGVIKGASYRNFMENIIESGYGWSRAKIQGDDPKRGQQMLERDFMRVKYGETRF